MWDNLLIGISIMLEPTQIFSVFVGVITGILVGAMPGLSATMGCALILPFTFSMEPIPAISMLSALYCGAIYGGSISAILINTPGTGAAAMTTLDGYKLTQKGKAGKALGMAVIASGIGGLFSTIVLILFAPQLAKIAIRFAAPEYFGLTIFGISMVIYIKSGSELQNMIGALIGIFLSLIGMDAISGFPRFTFGNVHLTNGINFIPVMIGIFAAAEVFKQAESWVSREKIDTRIADILPSFKEMWPLKWSIFRSAVIGTFIGILPAGGGTIASFIGYNEAKRWSKNPEKFGTGILEGVAAPEAANNAATGGAMIPTLTLGIPGSSTTAVILGGLMIQGLRPGPLLFITQTKFVYSIFIAMAMANLMFLLFGLIGAKVFSQVTKIPTPLLTPIIIVLCFVGSYALHNNIADVWVMIIAGITGYFLRKINFSAVPIALGMVLGELIEISFRQSMSIFDNNFFIFFTRPFSATFLVLTLLSVTFPFIRKYFSGFKENKINNK